MDLFLIFWVVIVQYGDFVGITIHYFRRTRNHKRLRRNMPNHRLQWIDSTLNLIYKPLPFFPHVIVGFFNFLGHMVDMRLYIRLLFIFSVGDVRFWHLVYKGEEIVVTIIRNMHYIIPITSFLYLVIILLRGLTNLAHRYHCLVVFRPFVSFINICQQFPFDQYVFLPKIKLVL